MKNAEGNNSPQTCRWDQVKRAARWLRGAGVEVANDLSEQDTLIEISPMFALTAEDLKARPLPIKQIKRGESVYLG